MNRARCTVRLQDPGRIDDELVLMKLNNPDNATVVRDQGLSGIFINKFDSLIKQSKKLKVEKVAS